MAPVLADSLRLLQIWGATMGLLFFFALGAVVGSFINVVVYRLPRGMNIVVPASRCPACGTKLRWRENFPVLGWIALRGRCRYCRTKISPEYPLVEFTVGLLYALLFAMWFMQPSVVELLGVSIETLRPDWAREALPHVWPMFLLMLILVGSLVAMTLVDAKTFTIPLALPWIAAAAGLVIHPAHAMWLDATRDGLTRSPHLWTIPTPGAAMLGAALGATAGLIIATLLLWMGVLKPSFADYEQWEKEAEEKLARLEKQKGAEPAPSKKAEKSTLGPVLWRTALLTGPAIALMLLGFTLGHEIRRPMEGMLFGMLLGLLIGLILRRLAPSPEQENEDPIWIQYPHARREVLRECVFLAPCLLLGALGWLIGDVMIDPEATAPLWLSALGGSLLGLLVGGGAVWAVRILGSLAFGKEAMGLGDVHLMAAVGACLGWIDPLLAFFLAPFFGILGALLSGVLSGVFRRAGSALPYGPYLAAATLLVIYARPLFEAALSLLVRQPVNLP